MTTRFIVTSEELGYRYGDDFSDISSAGDLEKAVIGRIVIHYGEYINSLTVYYVGSAKPATTHGDSGPQICDIVLGSGEWITRIEGTKQTYMISSLELISNTGRSWGPLGLVADTVFNVPGNMVPSCLASRMGLLYFVGSTDGNLIYMLQATFAEYGRPEPLPGTLKFERQTGSEPVDQSEGLLSAFVRQLMSPIITLDIGPKKTRLRAYEAILCRLPFFRAALQGEFKEATEKAITMPEDEPVTVGALIEFLYTGGYTYAFKPQETLDTDEAGDIPASDLTQGSFHVAVYAVANKYDCQELAERALRNFTNVLKQLRGLDAIELLKSAYVKGLTLSQLKADGDLQPFMEGLPKLVGDAYRTHHEEMEVMVAEYPILGSDLLHLVTISRGD